MATVAVGEVDAADAHDVQVDAEDVVRVHTYASGHVGGMLMMLWMMVMRMMLKLLPNDLNPNDRLRSSTVEQNPTKSTS